MPPPLICLQRLRTPLNYKSLRNFRFLSPSFAPLCRLFRTMAACSSSDRGYEDYYRYTSGRWLWDEDTQLQERYKRFIVPELKKVAAKSVGAQDCVSISKLAEGGFNKVFRLTMNDGTIVIARIPNPNAGPPIVTTHHKLFVLLPLEFSIFGCAYFRGMFHNLDCKVFILGL